VVVLDLTDLSSADWRASLARLEQCTKDIHAAAADLGLRPIPPLPAVRRRDEAVRLLRIYDYADFLREMGQKARGVMRWMRAIT
jgi:hypothetical protein